MLSTFSPHIQGLGNTPHPPQKGIQDYVVCWGITRGPPRVCVPQGNNECRPMLTQHCST